MPEHEYQEARSLGVSFETNDYKENCVLASATRVEDKIHPGEVVSHSLIFELCTGYHLRQC